MREDGGAGFAAEYGRMSETELMGLAASYDTLVADAQSALRAEFARRGMEPPLVDDAGEAGSERLVTVRRYRDLSAALVGRMVLESSGIFCFLRDENFVRLNWFDSQLIGGLRLQVRPEDEAEAEAALSQPVPEAIEMEGEGEFEQPRCPRCGSVEITFEGADRRAALLSLWAVAVPLPQGQTAWACSACGARWTDDEAEEVG